jgi:hypothetical protein
MREIPCSLPKSRSSEIRCELTTFSLRAGVVALGAVLGVSYTTTPETTPTPFARLHFTQRNQKCTYGFQNGRHSSLVTHLDRMTQIVWPWT